MARFKSTVAPSPPGWPGRPAVGFSAGDACRAGVTFGAVPTPTPGGCSAALGTVFYSFCCAFALGLAESEVDSARCPPAGILQYSCLFYPRTFVVQ